MKLVNLTPHAVTIRGANGDTIVAPSGQVARVSQTLTEVGERDGLRCVRSAFGPVVGLPEPKPFAWAGGMAFHKHLVEELTLYIVSAMVRLAVPHRRDVVSPADFVRNEAGQIIACQAMEVNP